MRKAICLILAVLICAAVAGCGNSPGSRPVQGNQGKSVDDILKERMNEGSQAPGDSSGPRQDNNPRTDAGTVDVDLTKLSSTMVYSEVYNMMTEPGSYLGKLVRMKGIFAYGEGDERYYFACVISDATACCAQGIEFVLKDERKFPEEYPLTGTEITVVGVFDTYMEGMYKYCQLVDAVIE